MDNSFPREITEQQEDGTFYIVYDREYDEVNWYRAYFKRFNKEWITTNTGDVIHPTHYVNISYSLCQYNVVIRHDITI